MRWTSITTLVAVLSVFPCTYVFGASGEQWGFRDTGVEVAHTMTEGSADVVVAIIDNGFDTFHPELRTNAWQNTDEIGGNGIDDDANGYIDDVWGWDFVPNEESELGDNDPRPDATLATGDAIETIHHATLVAGLVAGNGLAFTGIAPHVRLMNLRIVNESGEGTFNALPQAIRYAVDNGADIINMSIIGHDSAGIAEAVHYAYLHNVAVVAAAGNNSFDLNQVPFYPVCADLGASTPELLGVTAIDDSHRLSFFSNIGSSCIDITAPGNGITSTVRFSPTNNLPDHVLGGWAGTSFAAPFVSGALALVKSLQPGWTVSELYSALLSTTHHTPSDDEEMYANLFGKGLLQIDKAVQYAYERVVSTRIVSRFTFVDSVSGQMVDWQDEVLSPAITEATLVGIDDVVTVVHDGTRMYLTSRKASAGAERITLYTDTWTEESHFLVTGLGQVSIAVGDVTGDAEPEIVVAPKGASTEVFRVYSFEGVLLETATQTSAHSGVSIALSQSGSVIVYRMQGKSLEIAIYDHDVSAPTAHTTVDMLGKLGSVAVGDVDGDRVDDIIVGGAGGEAPFVSIYDMDGRMKRTFSVYGAYQGGFGLESIDYDRDGKDDILAVPFSDTEPVRIWSGRAKKLDEVRIFGEHTSRHIVPLLAVQ